MDDLSPVEQLLMEFQHLITRQQRTLHRAIDAFERTLLAGSPPDQHAAIQELCQDARRAVNAEAAQSYHAQGVLNEEVLRALRQHLAPRPPAP